MVKSDKCLLKLRRISDYPFELQNHQVEERQEGKPPVKNAYVCTKGQNIMHKVCQ